jgi:hypothetical protein
MNMTKKILVASAVMMVVAAMAAPAAMGDEAAYTATVTGQQNTVITVGPTAFPPKLAGETTTISDSLTLTNSGNEDASVKAKFTTDCDEGGAVTDDFGLDNNNAGAGSECIAASNFAMGDTIGTPATMIALKNDGTDATISNGADANKVPKAVGGTPGEIKYDVQLDIPAGQAADNYYGSVEISVGGPI